MTPPPCRVLEAFSLKVDNSSLTGESVAVTLKPDSSDPNHLESKNLAFYSTSVTEGKGKVGMGGEAHTVPGRGGEDGRRHGDGRHRGAGQCLHRRHGSVQVATLDPGKTPINKEISKFVHLVRISFHLTFSFSSTPRSLSSLSRSASSSSSSP